MRMTKMRTLWLMFFLGVAWPVFAAPYLAADPYTPQSDPNLNPVSFIIQGIGSSNISSQAYTQPSTGQIWLMYDLATLANGTYHVTAAAVNIFGGQSPFSSPPFDFTKGVPAPPGNLRILQSLPL